MISMSPTAYLALGSNLGDRMAHLRGAVERLRAARGITVLRIAPVYESEPVGVEEQPWFLNSVLEISTTLAPEQLLEATKEVERSVGRTPTFRWGPRVIDVDILLYDGVQTDSERLTIPHPRMAERLFVLLPLRDLLPDWRDSRAVHIDELIARPRGTAGIRRYPEAI